MTVTESLALLPNGEMRPFTRVFEAWAWLHYLRTGKIPADEDEAIYYASLEMSRAAIGNDYTP